MICYTIDQAAERVQRKPKTIRTWIRDGSLFAVRNPIDGQLYVEEERLLSAERMKRVALRESRVIQSCSDLR